MVSSKTFLATLDIVVLIGYLRTGGFGSYSPSCLLQKTLFMGHKTGEELFLKVFTWIFQPLSREDQKDTPMLENQPYGSPDVQKGQTEPQHFYPLPRHGFEPVT